MRTRNREDNTPCTDRLLSALRILALGVVVSLSGCADDSEWDWFGIGKDKAETYLPAEQLIMKGMDEFGSTGRMKDLF